MADPMTDPARVADPTPEQIVDRLITVGTILLASQRRALIEAFDEVVSAERQATVEEIARPMLTLVERVTKDFRDPYDALWCTHGGLVNDHLTDQWQSCELCLLVLTIRTHLGASP